MCRLETVTEFLVARRADVTYFAGIPCIVQCNKTEI